MAKKSWLCHLPQGHGRRGLCRDVKKTQIIGVRAWEAPVLSSQLSLHLSLAIYQTAWLRSLQRRLQVHGEGEVGWILSGSPLYLCLRSIQSTLLSPVQHASAFPSPVLRPAIKFLSLIPILWVRETRLCLCVLICVWSTCGNGYIFLWLCFCLGEI